MEFFDTHCHLDEARYGAERPALLRRALEAGVTRVTHIASAGSLAHCDEGIAFARAWPGVSVTIGVHPHEARHWDDELAAGLEERAREPEVVAIGEAGLDYHYDYSPHDAQERAFRDQIALARVTGKALVVHNRSSDDACARVLDEERAHELQGVVHCFSSGVALARKVIDAGWYLGFTGIVTFKNAEEVREALALTPRDRVLIETDSPFLAPVPLRGKRNEPAYVVHVAAHLARLWRVDIEEVAACTTANALRLYGQGAVERLSESLLRAP